jgi:predicted nucleotide-binding protein (sugar kinase/HSP70/actin superfamily)
MLALNISKAVEQLEDGALGVLNVVCHGCMVGILSESAFRPLREAYPGRPILTLTYDGLGDTHAATRVEAFLQRVLEDREEPR